MIGLPKKVHLYSITTVKVEFLPITFPTNFSAFNDNIFFWFYCFSSFFGGQLPGRKLPTFLYPYRRPFLYPYSHQFHRKVRRVGISYLATKMKNICIIM